MFSPADDHETSMLQLRRAETSYCAVAQPSSTSGYPLVPLIVVRHNRNTEGVTNCSVQGAWLSCAVKAIANHPPADTFCLTLGSQCSHTHSQFTLFNAWVT